MSKKTRINKNSIFTGLAVLTVLLIPLSVLQIALWTPVEAQLGIVQKIFYFHVPSAMMMYAGFGISFLASLWYLFGAKSEAAKNRADQWAASGAEVGQLFATLVLISGPLWARNSWGVFWTWDPQLTATFMIYLLFWSYLAVRAFAASGERRRTISAIIAILAAPNMAFIHWAVTVTHPKILRNTSGKIAPSMLVTLMICFVTITLLFVVIYWMRLRVEKAQSDLVALRERYYTAEDRLAVASSGAFALVPFVLLAQTQIDEFIPVKEAPVTTLPGGTLLVIAYAVMWAAVLLYIAMLGRRQSSIQSEMNSLRKQIDALEGSKKS